MQKVYQRINWENDPSTNTPINEYNLNKMDYALYELDKRVLTLGGYEERAALSATNAETSEINAKTSENNSKVSETNAKTSEINAKDYMERAYATTPEGYDELVETVRLMDIATTTESILEKSKPGGLKINHILGATEQNGTPTPSSPIGIKNVGDCVEMMQGEYNAANGNYGSSAIRVCNKNSIPCKSGDTIKIETEKAVSSIIVLYYSASGFLSFEKVENVSSVEKTVPSNATRFNFVVGNTTDTIPDTVGKISLTVNGKYVTPIKTHGKNFWKYGNITCSGAFRQSLSIPKGTYTVSFVTSLTSGSSAFQLFDENGNAIVNKDFNNSNFNSRNSMTVTLTDDMVLGGFYSINPNDITDIQIEQGSVMTDYEPYQETTAYIYTDEPIRDSDVVFNDNGVWKVERNKVRYVLDGTQSITSKDDTTLENNIILVFSLGKNINPNIAGISDSLDWVYAYGSDTESFYVNNSGTAFVKLNKGRLSELSISGASEYLTNNPISLELTLATPTYETLDTASQIALNSLETFDTVTYIEVDSRVQPSEIEVEYGTSKVGGYSLEALRNSKNNEKAIEENMKAITSGEVVVEYESEDDFAGRSWINVVTLMAGEKLKNILNMISAMFNNIRFLRNEVNKKMDANYGYLTEGDLNNIIYESGKAYCTTNVANIPIMERGWLEVLMSDDADMVLQRYTTTVGNKVFIRRLVKSTSNGWGEWSKCNLTSDDIVVDMVAKPATMNLPAWESVSIEIESKYLSLEYELLSANVYFVDDLSSGTLSDSNLCVDQVMTSTNTASAHCCVAKVRNASSSQINKGCYSVARFVLVKK